VVLQDGLNQWQLICIRQKPGVCLATYAVSKTFLLHREIGGYHFDNFELYFLSFLCLFRLDLFPL